MYDNPTPTPPSHPQSRLAPPGVDDATAQRLSRLRERQTPPSAVDSSRAVPQRTRSSATGAKIVTTGLSFTTMLAITAGYALADRTDSTASATGIAVGVGSSSPTGTSPLDVATPAPQAAPTVPPTVPPTVVVDLVIPVPEAPPTPPAPRPKPKKKKKSSSSSSSGGSGQAASPAPAAPAAQSSSSGS